MALSKELACIYSTKISESESWIRKVLSVAI